MRAHVRVLLAAITTPLLLSGACASPHPEEAAVLATLDQTVEALLSSDLDALWRLSDPDSQRELLGLLSELHEALALVPELYPDEASRARAREALGEGRFGSIFATEGRAGPRLLAQLLSPEALRHDQRAMDGVTHRDVSISTTSQPLRATVHTSGGESFAFVKSPQGWRSLLVRDLLLDNLTLRQLRDNIDKVEAARDKRRQLWRDSRDPRQPQGAYNIARAACAATPRPAGLLYSLLDSDARAVVVEALRKARDLQRSIQRRTVRKQRRRAYDDAGLSLYVDAKTDRELYARWVASDRWVAPLGATDPPDRVEGDPASGAVVVVTDSGARVSMVRDAEGFWRPAGQAEIIRQALLNPIAARLTPQR